MFLEKITSQKSIQYKYHDALGTLFLTEDETAAKKMLSDGKMVLFLLTENNRSADLSDIPYCAENPEQLDSAYLHQICQRFCGLPWEIAETDRLRIREMTEADTDALYDLYNDSEAARFLEPLSADREEELRRTRDYIHCMYRFWGFGMWILEEKSTGKIVGRAGFCLPDDREGPELGFLIHRDFRRMGYAQEACAEIIRYGKEELEFEPIYASADSANTASQTLLGRLGFHPFRTLGDIICFRL